MHCHKTKFPTIHSMIYFPKWTFPIQLSPNFKLQNYFHLQHIRYHSNPGGNINRVHIVAIDEGVEACLRWETLTSFPHIRILSNYIKIFYWLWCHTHASQGLKLKQAYSKTCVKQPLSKDHKLVFKTNYRLMQVKSIAEWRAFCNTFDLH